MIPKIPSNLFFTWLSAKCKLQSILTSKKVSNLALLPWPRLWPKCAKKRMDAVDKTAWNTALFVDWTDILDEKIPEITNRRHLAVMRSAVRSRLSPPKRLVFWWKQAFFITFLMFLTYRRYFAPPAVVPTSTIPPQKLNKKFVKSCQIGHLCENVNVHFLLPKFRISRWFSCKRKSISPTFTAKNLSNSATSGFQDCWCVARSSRHSPPKQSCFMAWCSTAWGYLPNTAVWWAGARLHLLHTRRDSDWSHVRTQQGGSAAGRAGHWQGRVRPDRAREAGARPSSKDLRQKIHHVWRARCSPFCAHFRLPGFGNADFPKTNFQTSAFGKSRLPKTGSKLFR